MSNLYSEEGFLSPKSPFDFSKSLDFLRAFTAMRDDQKIDELSLTSAVCIGGQTIVFNVRSTGLIKSPRLKYALSSEDQTSNHRKIRHKSRDEWPKVRRFS